MTHDSLILALTDQVACYRKLSKLADQQHIYVQNSQTDQLLDVLQRRQEVLDQIADLEKVIGPAKRDWPNQMAALPAGQRDEADSLLAETRRLLEQITTADRNDAIVLQQRKLNLGIQINKTTAARVVNKNYAAAAYVTRRPTVDFKQ
jgi:hypothetical protein